ncbi:hypothetical protein [Halosegnis sp.]|uniref:DUF7384 family protein n=1 Tax=Halosegnis sp. TaxID=2864959 RepID=UPI0035D40DC4
MTTEPDPTRVVADADVLAADLLVGGRARDALDALWCHSWTTLIASQQLLADTEAIVARLADSKLAAAHRARLAEWTERVDHPPGDHPGLASAYRSGAPHLLSLDPSLTSVSAGANLRAYAEVSVRTPDAFAQLFDPERLWPTVGEGPYPGPDREPRR